MIRSVWSRGEADRCIAASYLQLVLTGLGLRRRVEEVDRENLLVNVLENFKMENNGDGDGMMKN